MKKTKTKKARFSAGFLRYLADSNRRPRFCRPIPNHSGKVPFAAAKIRLFCNMQHKTEKIYAKPRADNFIQFQTNRATKSNPQYT